MRMKKLTVVLLIMAMVTASFTGCGSKEDKESSGTQVTKEEAGNMDVKDMYTVKFVTPGNEPKELDQVETAMNEKLIADGKQIQVDLVRIPWDAWDQKTNLMLTTGEKFDILHIMQDQKTAGYLMSRDYLTPLNELLLEFPELKGRFDDQAWKEVSMGETIAAIPAAWRVFGEEGRVSIRTDLLEKLSIPDPTTPEELITAGVKMKEYVEKETGQKAYVWTQDVKYPAYFLHRTYESYPFLVDKATNLFKIDQKGNVESWFETEEFKKDAEFFRELYKNNLISPDLLSQNDWQEAQNKGTVLWGDCFNYGTNKVLVEVAGIKDAGIKYMKLNPEAPSVVPMTIGNANGIPKACENPKAALEFLDWLYSDEANTTLLTCGIEGEHYTKVEGSTNKIVSTKDASNQRMYYFDAWQVGYYPYAKFEDYEPDESIAEQTTPLKEGTYEYSPVAGFVFDEANVVTEMANLRNEVVSSMYPIKFGMVEYEEAYPAAIEKLKAAGLQKVLDEYQKQLTEYMGQ